MCRCAAGLHLCPASSSISPSHPHLPTWHHVPRAPAPQVVKLSDAVQPLPKQTTEFVHGVAESFLEVGRSKAEAPPEGGKRCVCLRAPTALRAGPETQPPRFALQQLCNVCNARPHVAPGSVFLTLFPSPCSAPCLSSCSFNRGAYFIGKVVWAKGYTELLDLMTKVRG